MQGRGLGNQPLAPKLIPPHFGSPVKLNRAAQGVPGATSSAHISGVWAGIFAWTTTKPRTPSRAAFSRELASSWGPKKGQKGLIFSLLHDL